MMILQKFTPPFTVIVITILPFFCIVATPQPKLQMLHVFFRHGDKIPHKAFHNYPNDPYNNHSFYPLGDGGLTNEGKRREYKIGETLRDWYGEFFGKIYSTDDIYATSTSYPRTQMSLQLVLAGLFPPVGDQVWNENLPWQPISTVTETDSILTYTDTCALYKNEFKAFLQSEEARSLTEEHKATMEYLTKHSGKPINTTQSVYELYNVFKEEGSQNLTQPEWTKQVFPYPMKNITKLNFDLRAYTTKLKRLSGGVKLRKITEDMKDLCNCPKGTRSGPKAFFYSGHESNIASLSRTLGTGEPQLPEYGSTIIIETLQDEEKNSTYYVRIVLWTGVSEQRIVLKIPGCDEFCPMEKFLGKLKDVTADEYDSKCCVKSKNGKKNSASKNAITSQIVYLLQPALTMLMTILASQNYV